MLVRFFYPMEIYSSKYASILYEGYDILFILCIVIKL